MKRNRIFTVKISITVMRIKNEKNGKITESLKSKTFRHTVVRI